MSITENEVQRMESQIGELTRILANINKRLQELENNFDTKKIARQFS